MQDIIEHASFEYTVLVRNVRIEEIVYISRNKCLNSSSFEQFYNTMLMIESGTICWNIEMVIGEGNFDNKRMKKLKTLQYEFLEDRMSQEQLFYIIEWKFSR